MPEIPSTEGSISKRLAYIRQGAQRQLERFKIGCSLGGLSLPHPDTRDSASIEEGAQKRFMHKPPDADGQLMSRFRDFVKKELENNFKPLAPTTDVTFETWLANSTYSKGKKRQLTINRLELSELDSLPALDRILRYKSFCKREFYDRFKLPRCIQGPNNKVKGAVGRIFAAIEKEIFQHKCFIKKIPVRERPKFIENHLMRQANVYAETDFSSFEALFTPELLEICEFQMYEYMTKYLPEGELFMKFIRKWMLGKKKCNFGEFTTTVEGKRMSGDMCTSLGNGFTNFMIMKFVFVEVFGLEETSFLAVFEGDDGLLSLPPDLEIDLSVFERMGLEIKFDVYNDIHKTQFCGLLYNPDTYHILSDPMKFVIGLCWLSPQYARATKEKQIALLRCKALSYFYLYEGCPIIDPMVRRVLQLTSDTSDSTTISIMQGLLNSDYWLRQRTKGMDIETFVEEARAKIENWEAITKENVRAESREIIEERFGWSIEEQLCIEKLILENLNAVSDDVPLPDWLRARLPEDWLVFSDYYVKNTNVFAQNGSMLF